MQPEIVPVRVDYGRLILEWVIVAVVVCALAALILFAGVGVKPVVPVDISAGLRSPTPLPKTASDKGAAKDGSVKPFDASKLADEIVSEQAAPSQTTDGAKIAAQDGLDGTPAQDVPPMPDLSAQHRYLFACLLIGMAALVLTGLYPPWIGRPLSDEGNATADRPSLIAAGYGWLWRG